MIGEIEIRGNYDSWIGISPLTKLLPNESGKEYTTGYFQIFVEYYPLEDEAGTGASISILQGLRTSETDQYRELQRGIYPEYRCEFDKVELDKVDDRGYFRIVEVK